MKPQDFERLIQLCDQVVRDLESYDSGTDYNKLQIGIKLNTLATPLILGDELIPALREAVPSTQLYLLKRYIFGLRGAHGFTKGKSSNEYAPAILKIKAALEACLRDMSPPSPPKTAPLTTAVPTSKPKIFLVHGRDDAVKHDVARFIDLLGAKAIILHEQPNIGRTIITKFQEVAAEAAYAVVLMTPDDEGGLRGGVHKLRARQNVIFELGFFIGLLGSNKVCALLAGDIERPSDYDGVVYVAYAANNETWKIQLIREFRAAGIAIDTSNAF